MKKRIRKRKSPRRERRKAISKKPDEGEILKMERLGRVGMATGWEGLGPLVCFLFALRAGTRHSTPTTVSVWQPLNQN